jgi:mono/diheme cytochrome c family protein
LAWGLIPLALRPALTPAVVPTPAAPPPDAARVYAANCAYCHGVNGDARGQVILQPPARYFGRDKFKFATTLNGIPSDDDLLKIINRGIPGSAMPSFANLPTAEKEACLEQIRRFTRKGLYQRRVEKAKKDDDDIEPEKFAKWAAEQSIPGAKLPIPTFPQSTPEAVARGRAIYLKAGCVSCHGPEGKGDGPQVKELKNDDGTPNFPRDLTLGLFKGGSEPADLYTRIMLGIPGTPMPASNNQPQADIIDLIQYLRTLPKQ